MKSTILANPPRHLVRTTALLLAAVAALFFMSQQASAQGCGYGGYRGGGYGGGVTLGYRSSGISLAIGNGYGGYGRGIRVGYSTYRPSGWHNTTHYDYHPAAYIRHRNHYDYRPGHYDLHRTGHRHH